MLSHLMKMFPAIFVVLIILVPLKNSYAETVNVAVASNALAAINYLANEFTNKTGHTIRVSSGSTGKLYAQIIHGAPYDVFLAANEREPRRLEKENQVVEGTRFTYALGRLVLLSSTSGAKLDKTINIYLGELADGKPSRLSIANPRIAPYGLAAKQVLEDIELWAKLQKNIIRGENINQAFQYVVSGNAKLGLVALSQVKQHKYAKQQYLLIPNNKHESIKQQVVVLKRARDNAAARAFLDYLMGDEAGYVLKSKFGYDRPAKGNS